MQKNIDELGITEILKSHNALSACDEIEGALERFFNSYIRDRNSAKSASFTRLNTMLYLALQNADDYDSKLSEEIQNIIAICNKEAAN